MTTVALPEPRTLFSISDDLQTYFETLEMLQAQEIQYIREWPQEDRSEIEKGLAEVQEKLDTIGAELATKTDAVAGVLRRLSAERDLIEDEEKRLHDRRKSCERAEKWLREYVVSVMRKTGNDKLKTASNTLYIRQTDAVVVLDAAKVPAEYQNAEVKLPLALWLELRHIGKQFWGAERELDTVRVKAEPSLSTIKKAIKSGVDVPGADLQINEGLCLR